MLFCDPAQHVIFAGIGSVFTIANSSHKRFQAARDEWDKVKEKHLYKEKNMNLERPLLFGGFSFDQEKRKRTYGKNSMIRHFHYQHFY